MIKVKSDPAYDVKVSRVFYRRVILKYNSIWKRNIRYGIWILTFLLLCGAGALFIPSSARADQPVVIVIDPGHGGENLGAEYEEYTEKDMTLVVARAMKEELEKYEGVVVYLTHETDQDMSIKDRAAFAGERNADFLFCLHFNSSVEHNLFGAEVWVPATGEYYAKGYSFAQIQMQAFTDLGLYSRGIKTRLNDKDENYYGILRYCASEGVPAALIEHCHLDQDKDKKFYQQGKEQLEEFGRLDATAAARYFGLKSSVLGVDYSDYPVPQTDIPSDIVRPDKTEPELCSIDVVEINEETGEVTIQMEAEDSDSYILYYRCSIDGGNTYDIPEEWPRPEAWNQSAKSCRFTITVPFDEKIELLAAASNGFDKWTESNLIEMEAIPDPERLKAEAEEAKRQEQEQQSYEEKTYQEIHFDELEIPGESGQAEDDRILIAVIIAILVLGMIFTSFFMAKVIFLLARGNKKR